MKLRIIRCPGGRSHQRMQLPVAGFDSGSDIEPLSPAIGTRCAHEGVHHVVDKYVVPGVSAVTEHLGDASRQQRLRENGHDARLTVRILARPIHIGRSDM